MIKIHWDFTTGHEVSYQVGLQRLKKGIPFETHCLEFFRTDNPNTVVVSNNNEYISVKELLRNNHTEHQYTVREIRRAHNLRKMLVAGSFQWRPNYNNEFIKNINTITGLTDEELKEFDDSILWYLSSKGFMIKKTTRVVHDHEIPFIAYLDITSTFNGNNVLDISVDLHQHLDKITNGSFSNHNYRFHLTNH